MKEKQENIVDRIKVLLMKSKVSIYKVCKACGIRDSHFSEVLKYYPKRNFTTEQIKNLSIFFGVTTDWLILGNSTNIEKDKLIQTLTIENLNLKKELEISKKAGILMNKVKEIINNYDNLDDVSSITKHSKSRIKDRIIL